MIEQAKFELAWRSGGPILDYRLAGYWTEADALAWLDAMTQAVAMRSNQSGPWYMLGNLSDLKAQSDSVNTIRDEVTQLALRNGLGGCVMYGITGVRLMQLKRLLVASGERGRFAFAETPAEAEERLAHFMTGS